MAEAERTRRLASAYRGCGSAALGQRRSRNKRASQETIVT